jgi:hypothetical protein
MGELFSKSERRVVPWQSDINLLNLILKETKQTITIIYRLPFKPLQSQNRRRI